MSGPDDRTQALLDLIEGVIWEVDPVTRCNTYVSRKLEPIFGYSPEQWLSTPDFWDQCIHPQDQARIAVETERGLALGRPYHLEYRMLTGDGRTVWVRDVITPRFENGELKTLGGVMIDCTEQKQAQEALGTLKDHLAKVFQASPVGISISGLADGRLLDANPVFADLTGYSHQELMGAHWWAWASGNIPTNATHWWRSSGTARPCATGK